jgi:hypothetical protein
MFFRLGQKVVCVDASCDPDRTWDDGEAPTEGAVYTIASLNVHADGTPILSLVELRRTPLSLWLHGPTAGYKQSRFRPVVEKKTDISIFVAMLTPNKVKELT